MSANIRECTPFGSLIVMSHISALASGLDEFQQIGIELIFVGVSQPMRCAGIDFEGGIFYQFCSGDRSGTNWHNLVIIPMNDEGGDIKLFEVFGEVSFRKGFDAVEGILVACHHALKPKTVNPALKNVGTGTVKAKEGTARQIFVELGAVS